MIPHLPPDIAAAFPFEPRWADVAGRRLHYVDEGPRSDSAIVLLHGNPTWSFLYRDIIPTLVAAGHRVVAPDHLGSGRSDHAANDEAYAIAHHAGRLLAVLDHAAVDRAVFFLQDWGGPIGMAAGASRAGLFRGAVLGNTFWGRGSTFHHRPWPWRSLHAPVAGPLLFGHRPVFVDGAGHGMPPDLAAVARRAYRLPWEVHGGAGATLAWPRAIALDDGSPTAPLADLVWSWMATADVPVRWVWGGDDVVFPPGEQYEAMAERFPRGREHEPVLVAGAKHFIQEWAPDACAAALIDVAAEALGDGSPAAQVAPPTPGLVPPLPVLVDEGRSSAAAAKALGEQWRAPSGRTYRLSWTDRLLVWLLLGDDRICAHPSSDDLDRDLLELAGAVADHLADGWSSDGTRNVARVWGGWDPG